MRGVTDTSITIGLGLLDASSVKALIPSVPTKDEVLAIIDGILARWKRENRLVVNGRKINFKVRWYQLFVAEQERAACTGFVQEDKAFAVVAWAMQDGLECLTREFKTPTLTALSTVLHDDMVQRTWPYMFSMSEFPGGKLRNWMYWAHTQGHLKGKRLGILSPDDARAQRLMDQSVRATLERLGYKKCATSTATSCIAADLTAPSTATQGQADATVVQRLRLAGVDLMAIERTTGFEPLAEQQGYRPKYLWFDGGQGNYGLMEDAKDADHVKAQFDGTVAMTQMDHRIEADGRVLNPEATTCLNDWKAQPKGRKDTQAKRDGATLMSAYELCETLEVAHAGLVNAGRNLNVTTFIHGIEAIHDKDTTWHPKLSFGPKKHDGATMWQNAQFHFGRMPIAWVQEGNWQPLWVQ